MSKNILALKHECAQSCLTLCHPLDCNPPGSSVHEIFQSRIWEWVVISGDLPNPGIKVVSLASPALAGRFVTTEPLVQFSSGLSRVRLFVTPWTAAHQASLSITNSQNLPKLMSIKSVMPSSHLILCHSLLLLLLTPPSIRVFSNESTLRMRWPKY